MKAAKDAAEGKRPRLEPCRRFERTAGEPLGKLVAVLKTEAPAAEELALHAAGFGMCPYYVSRELLKEAALVTAPYGFRASSRSSTPVSG